MAKLQGGLFRPMSSLFFYKNCSHKKVGLLDAVSIEEYLFFGKYTLFTAQFFS